MEFISTLISSLGFTSPTFRDSFWPNFWATVLAGTLLSGAISWLLSKAKMPKLDVSLEFTVSTGGRYTLRYSVLNLGRVSFDEKQIHWHVYFDEALKVESPPPDWAQVILDGKSFWYFHGAVELPCFSGSATSFFEIPIIEKGVTMLDLHYYYSLSTVRGFFPQQSILSWLRGRRRFALGGNQFLRMAVGEIKSKAI